MSNETWSSFEDLGSGIFVYHDVLPQELNIINRLEENIGTHALFSWSPAYVGYQELMPAYRDCVDFKFKKTDLVPYKNKFSLNLQDLWQDVYDRKKVAVEHYRGQHNLGELRYWEAFNFVKYGPGHHFGEHADHGHSYNCTVSLVGYVNDDYEGGELYFRLQKLNIKPKAGDLFIFPSNYMYPHQAMPVTSGIKYSIVTMLDYSDKYHDPKFYQETGT
jgi:hypothetical protein